MLEEAENGDFVIRTVQTELSTLKTDTDELANNYDHFSYDISLDKKGVTGHAGAIDAIKQGNSDSSFNTYRSDVSDHLPVYIEINV